MIDSGTFADSGAKAQEDAYQREVIRTLLVAIYDRGYSDGRQERDYDPHAMTVLEDAEGAITAFVASKENNDE